MGHIVAVLPAFLLACVAVAALPGPSTALFLHRTVRDGRKAGLAAVAGNEIGVFCWALAAGAGLTALLRANAVLFVGMHVLGAAVLVYLGVTAWRAARRAEGEFGEALQLRLPAGRTPMASFRASLVTIAANPKAAVFAGGCHRRTVLQHGGTVRVAGEELAVARGDPPTAGTNAGRNAGLPRHRPRRRDPVTWRPVTAQESGRSHPC
jgi:threonine/homoserine/homoserine lactone efflux protein